MSDSVQLDAVPLSPEDDRLGIWVHGRSSGISCAHSEPWLQQRPSTVFSGHAVQGPDRFREYVDIWGHRIHLLYFSFSPNVQAAGHLCILILQRPRQTRGRISLPPSGGKQQHSHPHPKTLGGQWRSWTLFWTISFSLNSLCSCFLLRFLGQHKISFLSYWFPLTWIRP